MHDYIYALLGGILLGCSVVGYLYTNGRVTGISGMFGQILNPKTIFTTPEIWFISGLIFIPFIYQIFMVPNIHLEANTWQMILAGLLVGFGTRLGSGCTSGHGICGISRLSKRSIVATLCFMLSGAVTVFVMRHIFGA